MRLLLLLTTLSLFCATAEAQSAEDIRVRVTVSIDSEQSSMDQNRVLSNIERGLRSLGDVQLTDQMPKIELKVSAMEARSGNDESYGYVLSVIVLIPNACGENTCWYYLNDTLFTVGQHGLDSISKDIVAWFDQGTLRAWRYDQ